jgi:GH35 family endo-1,4-beta-xylanase
LFSSRSYAKAQCPPRQGWLPGSVSASDLVNNVIPQHVQQEIGGMGSGVTSWDVVNEIVGDGVSNGMVSVLYTVSRD